MCGISGKLIFNKNSKVTKHQLSQMASKISHRGPDYTGYYINKNETVGFAHNRLAIIDLSKNGNQPMTYKSRYVITFNGEIYNYKEEKTKLQKEGYQFESNSDTEVILALFDKYREKCLSRLRGMFAFVIYDQIKDEVFIARDRLGKKPFKYYHSKDLFIFASELKAILTQNEISKEIDYIAIQKYFLYGYVPSPLTGFKNIQKLEPATYILIDIKTGRHKKVKYWEPKYEKKLDISENEWSEKIISTLEESVKYRMVSDVPVGAFLSGGVDSSAVTALMALNSNKRINTFTITYKNKKWSEAKYAKIVAKKYNTRHHEILVEPTKFEELENIAYQYEEPFSDNSAVVSSIVSKEARKYLKVVLNGDGGDELFAGYSNRYNRLKRDVDFNFWLQNLRPSALRMISILRKIADNSKLHRIDRFIKKTELPLYERFISYNQIFSYSEIIEMSTNDLASTHTYDNLYKFVRKSFDNFEGRDLKDAGLKFDLTHYLPDLLLTKMDIATMRYGLETRSPILDYKFVELTNQIPFSLKIKNGETKYIFKKALEKIVPMDNLYRPKMGFTISLEDWFKEDLKEYYNSKINNNSFVKKIIDINKVDLGDNRKKWNLLMLELWHRAYFT